MRGWVDVFRHKPSGLKDRLHGAGMGGGELAGASYSSLGEECERVNYIRGRRNSREEIDSGDSRKQS